MLYCKANVQKLQEKTARFSFYSEIFCNLVSICNNQKSRPVRDGKPQIMYLNTSLGSFADVCTSTLVVSVSTTSCWFSMAFLTNKFARQVHIVWIQFGEYCPLFGHYTTTVGTCKGDINKNIMMRFPLPQCATYNNMAHKHENKTTMSPLLAEWYTDGSKYVCVSRFIHGSTFCIDLIQGNKIS